MRALINLGSLMRYSGILFLLDLNSPHFQGQCIDHVFIPLNTPSERIFVNVIPSGFKDHAMIIGGTSIKE